MSIAAPSVRHAGLYLSTFAAPAPLDQAVRRIATPPRTRRMRAYRVPKHLHVPARLRQEPSRRKKNQSSRSNSIARRQHVPCGGASAEAPCATTSHPVPACDIRLRPYWHAGSCQAALAIYRRLFAAGLCRHHHHSRLYIVASRLERSACRLHGSQAGFPKNQMRYNNIIRSTSKNS